MIGRRVENYKIISILGEGGMGIVYKVYDLKLERYAALKVLSIGTTTRKSFVERFKKEARNQANLSHPNIVSVYGFVEDKDIIAIAMEYVDGETLESMIERNGSLSFPQTAKIVSQVLNGIAFAHSQGFIHRDLKPSNIIMDTRGNIKIMDFGISKSIDETEAITQRGTQPGTLQYMSPEQLTGSEVTVKSDLYALSVTMYEMLSGSVPFPYQTYYEIIDATLNKIPFTLSKSFPKIPPDVDKLILRGMGKASDGNLNSAIEFKEQLDFISSYYEGMIPVSTRHSEEHSNLTNKHKTKGSTRFFNLFLVLIFILLIVAVSYFVKDFVIKEEAKDEKNFLTRGQNYFTVVENSSEFTYKTIPLLTDLNLRDISFFDNSSGIICGDKGTLLFTKNNGTNWKDNSINTNSKLFSITYFKGNYFIGGENGSLFYSSSIDGSWKPLKTNTNESIFKIKNINNDYLIAVGSNGLILISDNSGTSWNTISSSYKTNFFSVASNGKNRVLIGGWDGFLLISDDYGQKWKTNHFEDDAYIKDIAFISETEAFAVGGGGIIWWSDDSGDNWTKYSTESISGLQKVIKLNNNTFVVLGNRGKLYLIDRNDNKISPVSNSILFGINSLDVNNRGELILVGDEGKILNGNISPGTKTELK